MNRPANAISEWTRLLAIDPGPTESAWCVIDQDCEPVHFGKQPNHAVLRKLRCGADDIEADHVAVEMVASYGMAVGAEVFETCVWIGRFVQAVAGEWYPYAEPTLTYRRDIKLHHCGQARAKDTNVRQALVDRFAPGQPNHGKGTKASPGFFYGFKADVWQAYALAVYRADQLEVTP